MGKRKTIYTLIDRVKWANSWLTQWGWEGIGLDTIPCNGKYRVWNAAGFLVTGKPADCHKAVDQYMVQASRTKNLDDKVTEVNVELCARGKAPLVAVKALYGDDCYRVFGERAALVISGDFVHCVRAMDHWLELQSERGE